SLHSPSPPLAVVDPLQLRCGGEGRGEGETLRYVRVLSPPHPSFGHLLPRFGSIARHRRTGGEGLRLSPHSPCQGNRFFDTGRIGSWEGEAPAEPPQVVWTRPP